MAAKENRINRRLQKAEQFLKSDRKRKNAKNAFIEKFVLCEICCKEAIHNATGETIEKVQLHMPEIKKGMKGYPFDGEKLKKLFYGKSGKYYKRGSYSAKNLRDSIMHSMSTESMQEVYDRKGELDKLMDSYLRLFR